MTDDQTRRVDATEPVPTAGPEPPQTPATEPVPAEAMPAEAMPAYVPPPTTMPAPSTSGATAAPGTAAPVQGPGSSRARWIVGLGVAGLAIAIGLVAFLLLSARPTPEALRYIPGDSAVVAEVRLDLPGDQMQRVGNLLAHFPGFQDQSTLPAKIDESLSQLVGMAAGGSLDFRTDLKPWLNGPTFIAVDGDAGNVAEADSPPLISATTNGAVDCATTLGGAVTHETHRGLDVVTAGDGTMSGLACVVDGRQALLGMPSAVRAALDAKADGTGMDKNERYQAARNMLAGDQLATVFSNGSAFVDLVPVPSFGDLPLPGGGLSAFMPGVPDWTMVGIRAEDDALVVDAVAAPTPAPTGGPSLLPLPATHASVIASMVPADTLLLVENQGAGVSLQNLLTVLREEPALAAPLGILDGLGGTDELVGWIDDAGVAVVGGSGSPSGGILLVAADDAAARNRVATLSNLLSFAGLGGALEVRKATVAGVEVTTVVITDLGSLVPPGTLPDGVEPPAGAPIEFSIAAKGRVILIGVGEAFMTGVLNVQPGASLADQAGYRTAAGRSLAGSRTSVYLAVRGAISLAEGLVPADMLARWESDIKPYVTPIDSVSISTTNEAAGTRSRLIISVSQPPATPAQ